LSYNDFSKALSPFFVFSVNDVRKVFPSFDSKRLNEWQHKGYVQKIINKWWRFTEISGNEQLQYRVSNLLLQPSYVSLETALAHYQFIPEAVYSIEAITTVKTASYATPDGNYHYHAIKPAYFFGYSIQYWARLPLLMAEPEKAIIYFLYLCSQLNKPEDLAALRLNTVAINETINWRKLALYAQIFDSPTLNKRIGLFRKNQTDATLK
jgi:predicted transcriptional regulator of viral defense system